MKFLELKPSKEWHTSGTLVGGPGVPDLPMTRVVYPDKTVGIASIWRVPLFARLKFLFDGRITFVAMGEHHPPICIGLGDFFIKPKEQGT